MTTLKKVAGLVLAGTLAMGGAQVAADEFPSKPIRVIIPFAAGGQGDVNARLIMKRIEELELLDQPMVVVNMPGGAATIGIREARKADPDGHTLLYLHQTFMTAELMGTLDFSYTEMVPVAETNRSCMVTATAEGSGLETAQQWIDAAKANPKGVKEATLVGSIAHFSSAMMAKAAGMELGFVNAGGGADRMASILGNHTKTAVVVPTPVVNNPKLNALVYYGEERHKDLPDTPTAIELGYDVVSCLDNVWWAPGGTPDDVVAKLAGVFDTVLQDETLQAEMAAKDEQVAFFAGAELTDRLADLYSDLAAVAGDIR